MLDKVNIWGINYENDGKKNQYYYDPDLSQYYIAEDVVSEGESEMMLEIDNKEVPQIVRQYMSSYFEDI